MIHRKYATKGLIHCLSNIGLSESYYETTLYEASIVKNPDRIKVSNSAFVQFIYDNADYNTRTIDGKNSFHATGRVMEVTPGSAVSVAADFDRLTKLPTAAEIDREFSFLPIQELNFQLNGFKKNKIQFIEFDEELFDISALDMLWLYSKNYFPSVTKGWMSFREKHSAAYDYSTSVVVPMRFATAQSSNFNTLFTVLIEAATKAKEYNQRFTIVTFDQPLFWKATMIILSVDPDNDPHNLRSVFVRLGGFHSLMSFLGTTSYLMEGCGLSEAFKVIFAENAVDAILSGHAFARSIRGHILNLVALCTHIFKSCNFDLEEQNFVSALLKNESFDENTFADNPIFQSINLKFKNEFINKKKKKRPNGTIVYSVFGMLNYYYKILRPRTFWRLKIAFKKH